VLDRGIINALSLGILQFAYQLSVTLSGALVLSVCLVHLFRAVVSGHC